MNQENNKISFHETIARYLFDRKHFAPEKKRVKYPAFLPRNGETSVFRISGLSSEDIWRIGEIVANESSRNLKARGDLAVRDVSDEGLEVIQETRKHHLHANITGWSDDSSKNKLIAIKLADKASLNLKE